LNTFIEVPVKSKLVCFSPTQPPLHKISFLSYHFFLNLTICYAHAILLTINTGADCLN